MFGPPGQVFLYEWSKLRYGVFEEHGYPGDPLYPMFYSKQIFTANGPMSVYKPNVCTQKVCRNRKIKEEGPYLNILIRIPRDYGWRGMLYRC